MKNYFSSFVKYIVISFLILFISFQTVHAAAPVPNKTLKLILKKSDIKNPTVAEISTESIPPEDYSLSIPQNYYKFEILDNTNSILYTGHVVNRTIIPPDPLDPATFVGSEIEEKLPVLTLNLPFYQEAKHIRFFDEQNTLLLEVNLELYSFPDTTLRYAECDNCGYCRYARPPEDWGKCRACLYPSANTDPLVGDTLKVDGASGLQVKPEKGHAYTKVGCIISEGFDTESGRAAAVNFILRIISTTAGALGLLFLLYGAFLVTTSKGDVDQVNRGKLIIKRTVVGVLIVFLGVFIINFLATGVLKIPGFG